MQGKIDASAIIYPNVIIKNNVHIGSYCVIGEPAAGYYTDDNYVAKPVIIGENSIIRSHTVIYENVTIGASFQTGHHVTIREETSIGSHCSVGTLSDLQGRIKIGNYVRIHSNVNINQLTMIDDYVWIYPRVVTTNDKYPPMGNLIATHICKFAQVCAGSVLLPGITIGEDSLVGAGSVVTKDVPPGVVVFGNPAKEKCLIADIKDDGGNYTYPWRDYLTQDRGYPWQNK